MPSAFLERVQRDDLPEKLHDAWQKSMELRGDATFFEVFGNNPGLFDWYTERFYREVFYGGAVSRRIKELVRLRLSGRNRACPDEVAGSQGGGGHRRTIGKIRRNRDGIRRSERGHFHRFAGAALQKTTGRL